MSKERNNLLIAASGTGGHIFPALAVSKKVDKNCLNKQVDKCQSSIVGNLLNKETIFCERVNGKFILRRGFSIKKNSKVLIVEDVITTGKSSLECARLVKKYKSKVVGYACLINRSSKPSLKIKDKNIVSQIKLEIPTYKKNDLPIELKKIPITKPGSRYLK